MSKNKVLILKGKEFYNDQLYNALKDCQDKGYKAIFMPDIVDAKINAPKDSRLWKTWYSAPSLKVTGKTKQGKAVVIYAHVPNYLSNPNNLKKAIKQGLVKGAAVIPKNEFQRLLDLEDNKNVFVVDYKLLENYPSGVFTTKEALKHPQTIPFFRRKKKRQKVFRKT